MGASTHGLIARRAALWALPIPKGASMSTAPAANSDKRSALSAPRSVDEAAMDIAADDVSLSPLGSDDARSVPNPGITAAEMGAASFPASGPPATWTWDVPQPSPRS